MSLFHRTEKAAAPTTAAEPDTGLHGKRLALVFIGLAIGMFVSSLSETIASTALPTIVGDLHGVQIMQWVETTYILTSTITMPIYGRLGDTFGRKRLLVLSLGLYAAGKGVCGMAPSMAVLITGRAISGLGGGGLIILSQAILADVVSARQRGKYMGAIGAVFAVSNVLGPILGGWFVDVTGWRMIFWFTIPLAVVAMVMTARFLPNDWRRPTSVGVDGLGMALMAVAVVTLILASAWGGSTFAWNSWEMIVLIVACVAAWVGFVVHERRATRPIVPFGLFRDRNFTLVTVCGMLVFIGFDGTLNYMPTYLQLVNDLNPMNAGLMMVPICVGSLVTSTATGFIASKTGRYKWMPIAMCAVMGLGFFLMSTVTPETSLWLLGTYFFIWGFGVGLGSQILVLIVQNEFPHAIVGTATAANNFFRQIASTLGTAVVGSLFTTRLTEYVLPHLPKGSGLTLATLTPTEVGRLPRALQTVIGRGYWESLIPLMLWFVPLLAVGLVMMCFIKRHRLATTISGSGNHVLMDQTTSVGDGKRTAGTKGSGTSVPPK